MHANRRRGRCFTSALALSSSSRRWMGQGHMQVGWPRESWARLNGQEAKTVRSVKTMPKSQATAKQNRERYGGGQVIEAHSRSHDSLSTTGPVSFFASMRALWMHIFMADSTVPVRQSGGSPDAVKMMNLCP